MISLKKMFTKVLEAIKTMQTSVSSLQGSVSTLQGSVSSLQGSVTTLQGSVSSLQSATTVSYATGTKGTSASVAAAEVAHCYLIKVGKHVTCNMTICRWNGNTALGRNVTLFTIPVGYRPASNIPRGGLCMRYNSGNRLTVSCNMEIHADGTIVQAAADDVVSVFLVADWQTA